MAAQAQWQLSGDYFENCNCNVVCPCLVSKSAPLTSRPTEGECNVVLIFHIDGGSYDGMRLDGLNVVAGRPYARPHGEKEIGRSPPTLISAQTTSRRKRWAQSSLARPAARWRISHR